MFAQILLVGENVCFKKLFWWILPKRKRGSEPGSQGVRENILTVRGFRSTGLETSLSLSVSPSLSLRFKINYWGCSREKAGGERNFKKKSGKEGGKKRKRQSMRERDQGDGRGERREQAPSLATRKSSPEPAPSARFGRCKQVPDPPCLVQTSP